MNWPEQPAAMPDEDSIDQDMAAPAPPADDDAAALYPGDSGQLPLDARRVLCSLLSGPSLDAERHGQLWPVLLRHETVVRSRLAELFLELVIDREMGPRWTCSANGPIRWSRRCATARPTCCWWAWAAACSTTVRPRSATIRRTGPRC